jgi:soluble lytic murein transglycosylase-like protein
MRISNRSRSIVLAAAFAVIVITVGAAVFLLSGNDPAPRPASAQAGEEPAVVATTTIAQAAPTTTVVTSTTTAAKTTKTTPKAAPPKATMPAPTPHPVTIPVPPAPHPPPVPGCAPSFTGENAPKADVKAALLSAAGKDFWAGVSNPPLLAIDPPEGSPPPATEQLGARAVITVPPALIQAIAWQESGWQSAIKACDGGVGTMQIMDPTARWMNQRFGTANNYQTLAGNTAIGAEYLEWLIAYFGENNFGHHYDITNADLLTAVIVGYNAGPGAVQFANGHTVSSGYANNVKALMSSQPWAA